MKISVVIPAYNCEKYIAQTLDCVYRQTLSVKDIEIIVCLDAPTDNTAAIVRAWMRAHRAIVVRVVVNKTNHGVGFSRNVGVRYASGEFIHFLDSDDLINNDFYKSLYDAVTKSGADVAVASYRHQRRPNSSVVFDESVVVSNAQDKIDITRVDQHGMMWRYLIRRNFFVKNKFSFPEDMHICEDWLLANKMVFASNCIITVPGAVYMYRWREGSLISLSLKERNANLDGLRANMEMGDFLRKNGLRRCIKQKRVQYYKLFGRLCVLTVACVDNEREYRLFGWLPIMRLDTVYKHYRRHIWK